MIFLHHLAVPKPTSTRQCIFIKKFSWNSIMQYAYISFNIKRNGMSSTIFINTNLVCMKLSKTIGILKKNVHIPSGVKFFFPHAIYYLSHTFNMGCLHGELNITMLKNNKRELLDLSLEVTILHILILYSNYIKN